MPLCNPKMLLTMLAFIEPNMIERRQCIDDGTILRLFDVRVDLTRQVEDVQKTFIRQSMIQWGIIENSLEVVIMNQVELGTDMISLEVPDVGD